MAERPETRLNAIKAALAAQIAAHARDYPHLWRERPLVYVGPSASVPDGPRPFVAVSGGEVEDSDDGGTFNRSSLRLTLYLGTSDAGDPEGAMEALMADVTRSIEADVTIGGALSDGYLYREGKSEPVVDLDSTGGDAVGELRYRGSYTWNTTAP